MLTSKVFIFLGILVIGIGVIFLWERSKRKKNSSDNANGSMVDKATDSLEHASKEHDHSSDQRSGSKQIKEGTNKGSLPFNLNDIQDALPKKDRDPLSPEAQDYANELIKELEHNKLVLKDCMENPETKADFKLETYYGTIKQIELLDNDLIAKIVVLYSNLELFKGQKLKETDAKVQMGKVEGLLGLLT